MVNCFDATGAGKFQVKVLLGDELPLQHSVVEVDRQEARRALERDRGC